MGGDYSRERFDVRNDFHGILQQQGRIHLDANWNEWVRIVDRRFRAETVDIIGRGVVPRETSDGFLIRIDGTTLTIGPGRMYVDGLLAENHGKTPREFDPVLAEERGSAPLPYAEQPYLSNVPSSPAEGGPHLVYIDVWEREVTYLQKPKLIEQAVGIDTIAALQTVWQVKTLSNVGAGVTCATPDKQILGWLDLTRPSAARLSTRLGNVPDDKDPCLIPPGNNFRVLENQLYRIEIHDGGAIGKATFKLSRDNGSVATNVTAIAGKTLTVTQTGRDQVLRFSPGDWVEVTDDRREFDSRPGEMRKIVNVLDANQTIELNDALPAADFPTDAQGLTDAGRHTRIRRWDQKGEIKDINGNTIVNLDIAGGKGVIPVPAIGTTISLEGGIQINFSLDAGGTDFHVADYWTFAGRPVDGTIDELDNTPPRGIHHHYCRLAVVTFPGTVADCRVLWPPPAPDSTTDRGIHIKDVLIAGGQLRNDVEVPVALIGRGINVVCDTPVDRGSVREKPVCFVTLDLPYPFNRADMELWGGDPPVFGFQPLILAADVDAENVDIIWRPTRDTHDWLVDRLVPTMQRLKRGDRILAHLSLKGNFIWDRDNPERPALYLDGNPFGFRQANAPNTDIRFPSGDGKRGGDFEMWFWLVSGDQAAPGLKGFVIDPPAVAGGLGSRGTVTLTGPAPAGGALVTLSSGNNAVVVIPDSVTIAEGSTTASFDVRTNPAGAQETVTVPVTASLGGASLPANLTVQVLRLLRLSGIRIVAAPVIDVPQANVVADLADLNDTQAPVRIQLQRRANAIELSFDNAQLNPGTVVNGKTVIVQNDAGLTLPGRIIPLQTPNAVRWAVPDALPAGSYRVTIKGEGDPAIQSADGHRLDGDRRTKFPSGDNVEGGDYVFKLEIAQG